MMLLHGTSISHCGATVTMPNEPQAGWWLQVKQENPKLGRESSVTQVGMDAVYQFATAPRAETGMQGVIFRFMPDPSQVDAAVKVYFLVLFAVRTLTLPPCSTVTASRPR
jgi:Tic22-like family